MASIISIITNVLLVTMVTGLLTFVLAYYFRSNWRANIVGKHILYFMSTISGLFVYFIFLAIVGPYENRQYVNIVILLILNYFSWKIAILLIKIQRKEGEKDGWKEDIR